MVKLTDSPNMILAVDRGRIKSNNTTKTSTTIHSECLLIKTQFVLLKHAGYSHCRLRPDFTQINKSMAYFTVRRNVKFGYSEY